ncbi:protein FIP1 [Quercus suber]|uniref:protein FIP1 n=1 Tax=Quercus suber TaxID=58331 RepID=UPI0032E032CE
MATERERHASSLPSTSHQDNALFLDILHEAPLFGDRKSRSIFGSVFYCFCLATFVVLAVGAPWIFHPIQYLIAPLLCSCNVALLLVTGIFQQYLVYQVHKIRLQVIYIYQKKIHAYIPYAVMAKGRTAAMLLIMVWKPRIYFLSISTILRIIMVIEAICAGSFMSVYIGYVHQYNSLNSQPDVLKSLYSPLQPSSSLEGLRYHEGGRLSDEQMALLQYQRENLHFLSEEILRLQECLSKYERSNDGSTPQVDLAHMLAARDQELRTLTAEVNQLQSELRLARSLIAERDSEIQSVRATNNQYVEENERLRAILGEWSTRAAKLERALEVERMSNLELQKKVSTLTNQSNTSAEPTEHRGA